MAGLFERIISQGTAAGYSPARTQQSRDWYREIAQSFSRVRDNQILSSDNKTNRILPGRMYMFRYNPIGKKTLPYYDRFPLVFPISVDANSFHGINLHYLPHSYRAILMDNLYELISNDRYDLSTKIRMSYNLLNRMAKFKFFRPCIKRYIIQNKTTDFIYISPEHWDIALFLPTERFSKASKDKVWQDSIKKVRANGL